MSGRETLQVQMVSHACLKILGRFGGLLCDPWILNEPIFNLTTWKFPAAVLPPEEVIKDVDWVFITHSHEDHFHLPSLGHLPRDMNILLPNFENHASLRAHTMERVLRMMGFHNIRRLRPWQPFQLGEGVTFTYIPSAEGRSHDWENSGFVIEDGASTLLNMNDNLTDVALAEKIAAHWPDIDIAFIQATGVSQYPGRFRMTEEKMREEARRRKIALEDQRRMIEIIQPRRMVPCAGDFCWLDDKYWHQNWANRTTPRFFREVVERDYPERRSELIDMLPSDTWSLSTGLVRNHPEIDWDNYLDEIARVKQVFQPKIDAINAWIEAAPREALAARSREHMARVERMITRDFIDFRARFRLSIASDPAFSFVMDASPERGFRVLWEDDGPVDLIIHLTEPIWAAILDARLSAVILMWVGLGEQPAPFRRDIARFQFWLEYHFDLNRPMSSQVVLEPALHPHLSQLLDLTRGVYPLPDEWECRWLQK